MNTHKFTIEVEAETKEQAIEKLEAFAKISNALSHSDFIEMAGYIEKNPKDVKKIADYIKNPPPILKKMAQKFL